MKVPDMAIFRCTRGRLEVPWELISPPGGVKLSEMLFAFLRWRNLLRESNAIRSIIPFSINWKNMAT